MPFLSDPASRLLNLLAVFGEDGVPQLLFERLRLPQRRWNEDGASITASFDVESASLLNGLLEPECFDNLVKELVSFSWIRLNYCGNGSELSYCITAEAREQFTRLLSSGGCHPWSILALKLVCHVFPRDPILDER